VPVGDLNFVQLARALQADFDSGMHLANVPIERVLELAEPLPDIRKPGPGVPMLSYLDIGLPPLNPVVMGQWQAQNGTLYTDLGAANQIGIWVNRRDSGTTITVAYPDNAEARESVAQYVDLMKMVFLRAAEGRADSVSSPRIPRAVV
ncbi:MAG: acyltransferase, partial [Mycobacterium sp.]